MAVDGLLSGWGEADLSRGAEDDVLLAVNFIDGGDAFHCCWHFLLEEQLAIFDVEGSDLAIAGASEDDACGGYDGAELGIVGAGVLDAFGG